MWARWRRAGRCYRLIRRFILRRWGGRRRVIFMRGSSGRWRSMQRRRWRWRAGAVEWARKWDEVLAMARAGRVLCPLAPVHALMCFFTLCANWGEPFGANERGRDRSRPYRTEKAVLEWLVEFAGAVPGECFGMNP